MDTPPKSLDALKALTARPFAPLPAPPKVVVNQAPQPKLEPEELADLTDDVEMWAVGGTKIIDTPAPPSIVPDASPASMASTMAAESVFAPQPLPPAPQLQPSYPPVAISYAPTSQRQPQAKKSNAMAWMVGVGLAGLVGLLVVAAGIGLFIYRTNRAQDADLSHGMASKDWQTTGDSTSTKALAAAPTTTATIATVTTSVPVPVTDTPTATALTATTATARTVTAPANVPVAPPTATVTATATATVNKPSGGLSSLLGDDDDAKPPTAAASPKGDGTLQTYAAAAGKPVFVDGARVGTGGSRIKTACGRHLVAVGTGKGKTVNIPCNGSPITVGSPDGT